MARLITIQDLLREDPAAVEDLVRKAADLSNVYEAHLASSSGDGHTREAGIHASEVSGCDRRIVYGVLGTPRREVSGPAWRRRFRIGHVVHDMFQRDFEELALKSGLYATKGWHISFERELAIAPHYQQLAKEWDIFSHCDGVFTVRESYDGPAVLRVVLEIKTKSPTEYEKLIKRAQPDPDHVEQVHVYMACLDVPVAWFLYYNKGNQNYTGTGTNFLIRFDTELWGSLVDRFNRAHNVAAKAIDMEGRVLEEQLPPRNESIKCDFCAFSWTCKPERLNGGRKIHLRTIRGPDE